MSIPGMPDEVIFQDNMSRREVYEEVLKRHGLWAANAKGRFGPKKWKSTIRVREEAKLKRASEKAHRQARHFAGTHS